MPWRHRTLYDVDEQLIGVILKPKATQRGWQTVVGHHLIVWGLPGLRRAVAASEA